MVKNEIPDPAYPVKLYPHKKMNNIPTFQRTVPISIVGLLNYDIPILYDEIIALIRSSHGELNFNDSLIAISCRNREISYLASFDRDFDTIDWVKRIAAPGDFGPDIQQD
ncbi:MAG: PIN domain-containing protein [Candidatus Aminicenantes bacterium]|jgi:predicted nucleic acid-binding protein